MELSGVRSSWDMLARNSDLYFEVSAEFRGLFFESATGLFDFLVLALDFRVLFGELLALDAEFFVGLLQLAFDASAARRVSCCDCLSRSSVRIVASMVLNTTPMRLRELLEEAQVRGGERLRATPAR